MENELKLLLNELDFETVDVTMDTNLREIGVDSITLMQLIVLIEEKYGIEIEDDDIVEDNWETISRIMSTVEKYINQV